MKKAILCIDDIKTNLFILQSVIEDFADELYEVHTAESASDGLSVLLRKKIDLILLDVMMPEIDGFEAAKMIKSNKKTKDIPIIFVTAKNDDKTIEMCYKIGGNDYINKPFNHIELLSRISFHIQLKEKGVLLKQEKEYTQSILDLQENIILVSDGSLAINVNKALLDFYTLNTVLEFQNRYKCVCHTFIKEDGYFSLDLVDKNTIWIDEVIRLSDKEDVLVKISKNDNKHIFNLKATTFHDQYIVTLTDITQITQLSLEYKHEANFDTLTQIYNRNMFHRLIERKITIAKRKKTSFVFIILDIDLFKKVNDTHGHLVGDEVLKKLAQVVKKHIRDDDIFARWGGEEFVLTFDVNIDKGVDIANNLRKYIENEKFDTVERITCSFGITQFKDEDMLDSMILRADNALYNAKDTGRNKVCYE